MKENVIESGRNQSVDLIKIVAMIGVMSLHANMENLQMPLGFILSRLSGISVPLFFMVSGYLLIEKNTNWKYCFKKIYGIIRFVFLVVVLHWLFSFCFTDYPLMEMISTLWGSFIQEGKFWMFWYFGSLCILYLILPVICNLRKFHYGLLLFFVCLNFIVFEMDVMYKFEELYVKQTFRVWYWIFYFLLGALFKILKVEGIKMSFFFVLLFAFLFVSFVYFFKHQLGGIEYYFGNPLCWAYSSALFVFCLQYNLKDNKIISTLSNLFLPCYALHMFVVILIHRYLKLDAFGDFYPIVSLFLVVVITISISFAIMKVPVVNKVFRI